MKKSVKIGIGLVALGLAVALAGIAAGGVDFEKEYFGLAEETKVHEEIKLNADALETLTVDSSSAKVRVHEFDGDPYMTYDLTAIGWRAKDSVKVRVTEPGGNTTRIDTKMNLLFGSVHLAIDVYCAKDAIQNLKVDLSSGTIEVENRILTRAEFNLSSGTAAASGVTAEEMRIDLSSGSAKLTDCEIALFKGESSSGDIVAERCKIGEADCEASSGDLRLSGTLKRAKADLSSGSIRLESDALPEALEAESSSGDIEILIPESDAGFTLKYERSSGSISTEFEVAGGLSERDGQVTHGSGQCKIDVSVSSGSAAIRKFAGK